jgi:DNA-binding NtrC family response regulator
MIGINGEVEVVSFTHGPNRDSLHSALVGLGYAVSVTDGKSWTAAPPPRGLRELILLLGNEVYPLEQLLNRLFTAANPVVLAAFARDSGPWDERLLIACTDFFGWPCHQSELAHRVGRLFRKPARASSLCVDESEVMEKCMQLKICGESPALLRAVELLIKFARCDAPVFIEGETGTGKELAARATHYLGARRERPFVPVNSGAIPDNLLENELFGHEKGAFTDAKEKQPGLVEQADGGTLFFDEVDALSEKGQVTLLRFLDEQEYRPLGAKGLRKANVRIVSATNIDLAMLAKEGRFREDLMFRLNILSLKLPPLRERGTDFRLLSEHFLHRYAACYHQGTKILHPRTLEWMRTHPWKGNVRELENLLHRYYLITEGPMIRIPASRPCSDDAEPIVAEAELAQEINFHAAKSRAIATFETSYLRSLMAKSYGNISLAARLAGKDRSALRKLLHKHGINR